MVLVKLLQIFQDLFFNIFHSDGVIPKLIKPEFELFPVTVSINNKIKFNIITVCA
jgi:hypothetical protein